MANGNGDRKAITTDSLRFFFTLFVPLVGVLVAYYAGRADTQSDLAAIKTDIIVGARDVESLRNAVQSLGGRLNSHIASGSGGLPHPSGVLVDIQRVKDEVKYHEKAR
jgi:hypothetical protein